MSHVAEFQFLLAKWTIILAASIVLVVAFWPRVLPVVVFTIFVAVAIYKITALIRNRTDTSRDTP